MLPNGMTFLLILPDVTGLMYLGDSDCHPGDECQPLSTETRRAIESEVQYMLRNASSRATSLLVHPLFYFIICFSLCLCAYHCVCICTYVWT